MKKLFSISLILLLTLHFVGYFFVFTSLNERINQSWNSRFIENDFRDQDLLQMSFPISFPYLSDQKEFVHVDEQMEIEGKIYRIVKKKYSQDTLHIVYVNDLEMEGLQTAYKDWKNDLTQKNKASESQGSMITGVNYYYYSIDFNFKSLAENTSGFQHSTIYFYNINQVYLDTIIPPPKFS